MANINNRNLLKQGFDLACDFYEAGIDATPMVDWLKTMAPTISVGITQPTATTTAQPTIGFNDAVLSAIRAAGSSGMLPKTLTANLRQHYPHSNLGPALNTLKRNGQIEKNGESWYYLTKKVDKSLDKRRRQRGGKGAGAANASEAMPLAATG